MNQLILPAPDRFSMAGKTAAPEEHADLVVVGAGAAGCAAAIEAAGAGLKVVLVDENPVSPGLIGMDVPFHFGGRATAAVQTPERLVETMLAANPALAQAFEAGVDVRLSTCAWGAWVEGPGLRSVRGGLLGLADENRSWLLGFRRLVVAAGARDLNLAFDGSDLPGVMGAQGFYALVARYDAFAGSRVAILGTGRLALETAELALSRGIAVAALVEVRDRAEGDPARLAALRERGVEVILAHVPLAAKGGPDGVAKLVLATVGGGEPREIACDTICLAIGTVPTIELLDVLGAERTMLPERGGHVAASDANGATSLAEVFVAGDCAGLGGADASLAGQRAAQAALASLGKADPPAATVDDPPSGTDALAYGMDWARAMLDAGGLDVPACICEDVTRGEILAVQPPRYFGWRSNAIARRSLGTLAADGPVDQDQIKRLTRACMGACQARRCREQVAFLLAIGAGVAPETVPLAGYRAPVRPLPLGVLADAAEAPEMRENWNVWFGIVTQWIGYDDIGTEREAEQIRAGMPY